MKETTLAKIAGGAVVAAMLASSSIAFAQTYDTGAAGSGSAGTIVPTAGTVTPGMTGTATGATGATPGIPNTGTESTGTTGTTDTTTPGIPNTGPGDIAATLALLAVTSLMAVGGAAFIARQKYALR